MDALELFKLLTYYQYMDIKIWQSLIRLDVKWRRYGEYYILAKAFQALFLVLAI